MTTNRHGDQTRDLSDTISDLRHTLWALHGLEAVMHPAGHLEVDARGNLAMLIGILTERFDDLLQEAEERWHSTPAATPEPKETQP
jgi:hypothetical protein